MKILLNTLLLSIVLCTACKKEKENVIPPDAMEIDINLPGQLSGQYDLSYISYHYNISNNRAHDSFVLNFPIRVSVLSPEMLRLEMALGELEIHDSLKVTRATYNRKAYITSLTCEGVSDSKLTVTLTYSIDEDGGKAMFRVMIYNRRFDINDEYISVSNLPIF